MSVKFPPPTPGPIKYVLGHVRVMYNSYQIFSKDLPNMNASCDWLSETIVISVYDSFFRNYISIDLLSFIVLISQSQRLFI